MGGERTELGQGAHGQVSSSFLPLLPRLNEWCQEQAGLPLPAQLCGCFGPSLPWPGPQALEQQFLLRGPQQ